MTVLTPAQRARAAAAEAARAQNERIAATMRRVAREQAAQRRRQAALRDPALLVDDAPTPADIAAASTSDDPADVVDVAVRCWVTRMIAHRAGHLVVADRVREAWHAALDRIDREDVDEQVMPVRPPSVASIMRPRTVDALAAYAARSIRTVRYLHHQGVDAESTVDRAWAVISHGLHELAVQWHSPAVTSHDDVDERRPPTDEPRMANEVDRASASALRFIVDAGPVGITWGALRRRLGRNRRLAGAAVERLLEQGRVRERPAAHGSVRYVAAQG